MFHGKSFIRVSFSSKLYGGNVYEEAIDPILLKCTHNFRVMRVGVQWRGLAKIFGLPVLFCRVLRGYWSGSRLIVNFLSLPLFPFLKDSIIVLHHVDTHGCSWRVALHQRIANWTLQKIVSRTNVVIVVAKYWEDFVRSSGFSRVNVIYNPFDMDIYSGVSEREIEDFLAKYFINRKGIVYIGNPQNGKGYPLVLDALSGCGYQLVSSGLGNPVDGTAKHLDLSHREFIVLLHISECVVTFSQFKEGWCRVAHEAMLCATPVVGSGAGGMRELLEDGRQLISNNKDQLKDLVQKAIIDRKEIGARGRSYALQFNFERFEQAWQDVIDAL